MTGLQSAENGLPPLGTPRACCATVTGDDHRACPQTGTNEHGVTMCACKPFVRAHAYEPGESCSPNRVIPPAAPSAPTTAGLLAGLEATRQADQETRDRRTLRGRP